MRRVTLLAASVAVTVAVAPAAPVGQYGEVAAQPPPRTNQPGRGPIIDVHLHAIAPWTGRDTTWYPRDLPHPKTAEAVMRESLAAARRVGIVRAITSGALATVEQWQRAAPDLIVPATAPGARTQDREAALAALREGITAGRVRVIGEVGWQYEGVSPSDTAVEPYLALAEELDVPVAIHMGLGPSGGQWAPRYRVRLSSPLELEEALLRHPKLRVYVMHAGWPMLDEMVAMLYAFPNLYVDTGVIDWYIPRPEFHAYLRRLVNAGFGRRIMFGSDQMIWPGAIERAVAGVESADFLTAAQRRDIFYNNAVRFFRLELAPSASSKPRK